MSLSLIPEKTVIAKIPHFTKPWTELQKAHRRKFAAACKKARYLLADPVIRKKYQKKIRDDQTVYNLVLKDVLGGKL